MLVLSRKSGESIVIGHDIKITILEIRGNRVRVGIAAPENVLISRAELNEFWIEPTADEPVLAR
jgi:carbon storage regulator